MVAQEETPQQSANENSGTTFGKLKALSSSLLTAQDKGSLLKQNIFLWNFEYSIAISICLFTGSKMSPRPSLVPDVAEVQHLQAHENTEKDSDHSSNQNTEKNEPNKTANRASSCRVCLKSFKPDDFSKTCFECKYRVCEDCASYSKVDSAEDLVSF